MANLFNLSHMQAGPSRRESQEKTDIPEGSKKQILKEIGLSNSGSVVWSKNGAHEAKKRMPLPGGRRGKGKTFPITTSLLMVDTNRGEKLRIEFGRGESAPREVRKGSVVKGRSFDHRTGKRNREALARR